MFDATDLEIARREHASEMGEESRLDRAWSRWYDTADKAVRAKGWVRQCDGHDAGLDGDETTTPSDGYSIDGAYEAWERRESVETYIAACAKRRPELGL